MRIRILIALVCLCSLGFIASANAERCQVIHVPGDAATVPEALIMAEANDIIEVALGVHPIVGRNIPLKAGVTLRSAGAPFGGCVLTEVPQGPGDWRDAPVFVMEEGGQPFRMENITFRHWTLSDSPYQTIACPVIHVDGGQVEFRRCMWQDTYKQVIYFTSGNGQLQECIFRDGRGYPASISFGNGELELIDCQFHGNSWVLHDGLLKGSLMHLRSGNVQLDGCLLGGNGPLSEVLIIDRGVTLVGDHACMGCNMAIWEAELAGHAYLNCCEIVPSLWHVLEGGELVLIDPPTTQNKAMAYRQTSWSQVKALFD